VWKGAKPFAVYSVTVSLPMSGNATRSVCDEHTTERTLWSLWFVNCNRENCTGIGTAGRGR